MIRKPRQATRARANGARPGQDADQQDLFTIAKTGDGQFPATRKKAESDAGVAPPKKPVRGLTAGWGAEKFIPASRSLPVLAKASKECRGCDLCDVGTQTVFGEGPVDAIVMFVGEQPGDQEDRAGKPFVGPSGQFLDAVLEEVGIIRDECYVTNAVKHFKWEPRGTRRIHSKPNAREVAACQPWLQREIEIIKPPMLVCLGSTAAQSLLGRDFRVMARRGQPFETQWAPWTMATVHPSSLLRIPDHDAREQSRRLFVEELKLVAKQVKKERAGRA
jgi:uracil-DNA glycosylase